MLEDSTAGSTATLASWVAGLSFDALDQRYRRESLSIFWISPALRPRANSQQSPVIMRERLRSARPPARSPATPRARLSVKSTVWLQISPRS